MKPVSPAALESWPRRTATVPSLAAPSPAREVSGSKFHPVPHPAPLSLTPRFIEVGKPPEARLNRFNVFLLLMHTPCVLRPRLPASNSPLEFRISAFGFLSVFGDSNLGFSPASTLPPPKLILVGLARRTGRPPVNYQSSLRPQLPTTSSLSPPGGGPHQTIAPNGGASYQPRATPRVHRPPTSAGQRPASSPGTIKGASCK